MIIESIQMIRAGNPGMNEVEKITSRSRLPVELSRYYLHPGQLFATNEPYAVTTILGSCVAVCLWDARLLVGGMNHYMLPYWSQNGTSSVRFGNVAMEQLIKQSLVLGVRKKSLIAKLFGGACVVEAFSKASSDLGKKNIDFARQFLHQEGIPIIAEDVGGDFGRKLIFNTFDGSVLVKRIERL